MDRLDREPAVAGLLVVAGVGLVLNPVYLGLLLPYPTPGDGWDLTGLYHSAMSTVGFLLVAVGLDARLGNGRPGVGRALGLAVVAVAAVVAFTPIWNRLIVDVVGVPGGEARRFLVNPVGYPGGETVFVETAVALAFPLGLATARRNARGGLLVGGALVAALAVDVLLSFPSGFVGVLGLALLLASADLLGVPFAGTGLVAIGFAVGLGSDRLLRSSGAASRPDR